MPLRSLGLQSLAGSRNTSVMKERGMTTPVCPSQLGSSNLYLLSYFISMPPLCSVSIVLSPLLSGDSTTFILVITISAESVSTSTFLVRTQQRCQHLPIIARHTLTVRVRRVVEYLA